MSLATGVDALATRVATEFNTVRDEITAKGPAVLVLGPSDPVPGGTAAGTVVLRTA